MENLQTEQIAAIRLAAITGSQIQRDNPEIADLYRSGKTQPEIVEELQVQVRYNINNIQVAISAVCFSLIGFKNNSIDRCDPYSGLLSEKESDELCRQHRSSSGERIRDGGIGIFGLSDAANRKNKSKGGKTTHSRGKGIFAITKKQRAANAKRLYEQGKGIAALSTEERRLAGKKLHEAGKGIHSLDSDGKRAACLKSLGAQGMEIWSREEDEFLIVVLTSSEYTFLEKGCRQRDYERINREYHEKFPDQTQRTPAAIRARLVGLINTVSAKELIQLGTINWSNDEEKYLLSVLLSGNYTREYRKGRITYEYYRLAEELNKVFHDGEPVRIVKGTRQKALYLLNHRK